MHGMAALLARYNINAPSLFYYYYDFPNLTSCCCCCLTLTYSQHLFCLIKYIVRWTATPAAAPPVCPWNKCSTETLIKSSPLVLLPPTTITVKSRKIVTSVQIFLASSRWLLSLPLSKTRSNFKEDRSYGVQIINRQHHRKCYTTILGMSNVKMIFVFAMDESKWPLAHTQKKKSSMKFKIISYQ
jgi:hypothetical protein